MHATFWSFLILCVICATVCRILSTKVQQRDSRHYGDDDTRVIQEVHRGLQRMEDRIESLETILMERSQHRDTYSRID